MINYYETLPDCILTDSTPFFKKSIVTIWPYFVDVTKIWHYNFVKIGEKIFLAIKRCFLVKCHLAQCILGHNVIWSMSMLGLVRTTASTITWPDFVFKIV